MCAAHRGRCVRNQGQGVGTRSGAIRFAQARAGDPIDVTGETSASVPLAFAYSVMIMSASARSTASRADGANPMSWAPGSFPDAEAPEDFAEQVVGTELARDLS